MVLFDVFVEKNRRQLYNYRDNTSTYIPHFFDERPGILENMKSLDFLSIGDIVIDAFIELEEANVHCDINNDNCTISMKFADKIPYKDVTVVNAVGNSPNAAVSAARLGLSVGLMTNLGGDQNGKDCLEYLKSENISTDLVRAHDGIKTNYHYVLSYQAERTILIKHEAYPYEFTAPAEAPAWIYLSSIGNGTEKYHEAIADYLEQNPGIKLAFQPGTFQMKMGAEKLARIYKRTEIHFCNKEEAQRILNSKEEDVKELMKSIASLGPKIVCLTDGPNGAYAYDGVNFFQMPIYPDPKPPVERTGAGDAFSSTVTTAIAMGKSLEEALLWGPVNSMNVVQHIGAQKGLLSKEALENLLANAPEDYKVKKI